MIKVKKIANKGRGVIATENIPEGTLLEIAPVGVFPSEQRGLINKTEVFEYYFVQPLEYGHSKNVRGCIAFGLASLCNHTKNSNAYVDWVEDETGLSSHLITKKNITKGEEVTVFYTNIDEYADGDQFI